MFPPSIYDNVNPSKKRGNPRIGKMGFHLRSFSITKYALLMPETRPETYPKL
jgi:hypothetical protein